jgi:hypothetical protein
LKTAQDTVEEHVETLSGARDTELASLQKLGQVWELFAQLVEGKIS